MGTESYRRNSLNHFHAVGIAGTDRRTEHGWELLTFNSIMEKLGHKEVHCANMPIQYAAVVYGPL